MAPTPFVSFDGVLRLQKDVRRAGSTLADQIIQSRVGRSCTFLHWRSDRFHKANVHIQAALDIVKNLMAIEKMRMGCFTVFRAAWISQHAEPDGHLRPVGQVKQHSLAQD